MNTYDQKKRRGEMKQKEEGTDSRWGEEKSIGREIIKRKRRQGEQRRRWGGGKNRVRGKGKMANGFGIERDEVGVGKGGPRGEKGGNT